MSMEHPSNPYVTPNSEALHSAPWDNHEQMDYMQSVRFIWESPNWLQNLLLMAAGLIVMNVIPVLPGLVLMGYQCEITEALSLRRNERYPDFDFHRLMDYLVRGLWPFIVALIGTFVVGIALVLVLAIPVALLIVLMNAAGGDDAPLVLGVMVPVIVLLAITGGILANMFILPFMLRAVFTQDIPSSLDFNFAKDFMRRVWKEMLLSGLFLIAVAFAAQLIGLLLFCVGILVTIPVIYLSQAHINAQLYRLYLARGGEKIPLKVTPITATPV